MRRIWDAEVGSSILSTQTIICPSDVTVAMRDLKSLPDRGVGSSPTSGTKGECMSIVLRRDQIERLIEIYNHFHEIQTFTISLEDDSDMVSINFDLNDVKPEHVPENKFDKPFKKQVYK